MCGLTGGQVVSDGFAAVSSAVAAALLERENLGPAQWLQLFPGLIRTAIGKQAVGLFTCPGHRI